MTLGLRSLLILLTGLALWSSGAMAQPSSESVLVISRERVLSESQAAIFLNDAEVKLTQELQSEVDALKQQLAAEEQELTRLRQTLPRAEFDARVQVFDQRVRRERRQTQRRVAALQNAFRRARGELAEAMVPLLVAISRQRGARLVLDRDQILVAHPSVDVTEELIAHMNESLSLPQVPTLADLDPGEREPNPGPEPVPPATQGSAQ